MSAAFKSALADLLPPIIVRVGRRLIPASVEPTFSTFARAAMAAGSTYDASWIAELVLEKTRIFYDAVSRGEAELGLQALRVLSALSANPTTVLEFGGGAAGDYRAARHVLGSAPPWAIVETPATAEAGRKLENETLRYFTSVKEAADSLEHVGLVYTSGALQYTSGPIDYLRQMIALKAPCLFITRCALSEGDDVIFLHRLTSDNVGPGPTPSKLERRNFALPVTMVSKANFEAELRKAYAHVSVMREENGWAYINGQRFDNFGFFCRN